MREDIAMRIRRGLLFSGLFLIPVGGLTLLVRGGYIDADVLRDAWRLWPLVLVGLGLAILLGRTQGAALGSALSGLILGLIVGGALASGSWVGFGVCGGSGDTAEALDRTRDAFDAPATVAPTSDAGRSTSPPNPAPDGNSTGATTGRRRSSMRRPPGSTSRCPTATP